MHYRCSAFATIYTGRVRLRSYIRRLQEVVDSMAMGLLLEERVSFGVISDLCASAHSPLRAKMESWLEAG